MGKAQGEPRGSDDNQYERRHGGGDWDLNAEDLAAGFTEASPGQPCTRCGKRPAPVGLSICTPCYRQKIVIANRARAQAAVSAEAWQLSQRRHG